jgi:hypothetical protein
MEKNQREKRLRKHNETSSGRINKRMETKGKKKTELKRYSANLENQMRKEKKKTNKGHKNKINVIKQSKNFER